VCLLFRLIRFLAYQPRGLRPRLPHLSYMDELMGKQRLTLWPIRRESSCPEEHLVSRRKRRRAECACCHIRHAVRVQSEIAHVLSEPTLEGTLYLPWQRLTGSIANHAGCR
jgi:hypothetical protein